MATFKHALGLYLLFSIAILQAQKIPLIHSGTLIKDAIVLYDSGKYEDAIALYKTIPERDTNYVHMLSELAMTYLANKNYDEAIKTCKEGLNHQTEYKAHLLLTLGSALDQLGDYEQSVSVFESAIREFPYNYSLHYNLGITHYNHARYDKAVECFFNTLRINPFHPGSHLNLGRLAAFQGKKVRAMMSLGMYLSISNNDNPRLVFLEQVLNNEIKEEGTIHFEGATPFDRLDQIIRARVVLDKNFKPIVPVNAILVRQYQLFLDQLSLIEKESHDPWIGFYLPIYREIKEKSLLEPFLYNILASTNIEAVGKWKKKNGKKLDEFYGVANTRLEAFRRVRTPTDESGLPNQVSLWYNKNNQVEETGNKTNNEIRIGRWKYFDSNGVCTAEGLYDEKGGKSGIWKYYRANGVIKSVEDYATGEIRRFNDHGELSHRYFLKNDQIDGEVEVFFPCGELREKLVYASGKREGLGSTFYAGGAVESHYNFSNDRLEGEYVEYFAYGKLMRKTFYRNGARSGPYEEYYGNGKLRASGSYKNGSPSGTWDYYHMNGILERSGVYEDGMGIGNWTYYDAQCNLLEERTYDRAGKIQGEDIIYRDGKIDFIYYYNHGLLTGITYFDSSGEEISRSGDPSGTFAAKGYFPDGKLRFTGSYRKGLADGTWKYYHHEGNVKKQYTCINDTIQGEFIEYYRNGAVKIRQNFKDGQSDGYSTEYYIHGQVKEEGWYQNGNREQQWISWYPDGTMESDYYYRNGKLDNDCIDFNIDGKLFSAYTYRDDRITSLQYYDPGQNIRMGGLLSKARDVVEQTYSNGAEHSQMVLTCGYFADDIRKSYPDGKTLSVLAIINGRRHGRYARYYMNGHLEVKGQYIYGDECGNWIWYHDNGQKFSEGKYIAGERDSVWTNYTADGVVSSRSAYSNGERNGVSQIFATDGTLIVEKRFIDGDLIDYRTMTKGGRLGRWETFSGNETILALYPNGNKAYEESYKNGLLHGSNHLYYPDGQLRYELRYEDGDNSGAYAIYFPGGRPQERGNYLKDNYDGVLEYFNDDGTLHLTETYRMGVRNGKSVLYEKNSPSMELNYWGGTIID
jgi:uncharacterized protein